MHGHHQHRLAWNGRAPASLALQVDGNAGSALLLHTYSRRVRFAKRRQAASWQCRCHTRYDNAHRDRRSGRTAACPCSGCAAAKKQPGAFCTGLQLYAQLCAHSLLSAEHQLLENRRIGRRHFAVSVDISCLHACFVKWNLSGQKL